MHAFIFRDEDADKAHFASYRLGVSMMRVLIDHGADVNGVDEAGQTAMHSAAVQRGDAYIEFLADNGARLDLKDRQGQLPLDLALGAGGRGQQTVRESAASVLRKRMENPH